MEGGTFVQWQGSRKKGIGHFKIFGGEGGESLNIQTVVVPQAMTASHLYAERGVRRHQGSFCIRK